METAVHDSPKEMQPFGEERDPFDTIFAKRMNAAGITPKDHVGVAVSGGPDSTALCILLGRWIACAKAKGSIVGKLVGFVVDHGLRANSTLEALLVQERVSKLGIHCDVLNCLWPNGVPTQGHLQEAARNARYKLLQEACRRNGLHFLLTAHHADDQVELFIMRLSRHSGLAGLAGMPFVSEMFCCIPDTSQNGFNNRLLLVRPLLDFDKSSLYTLCRKHAQPWVEDPTNNNLSFLRNVVRKFLSETEFCVLRKELRNVIVLCRKMRTILDKGRNYLLHKCVSTNEEFGYAIMDLGQLSLCKKNGRFLSRVIVATLQFVAQKDKPPRGKAIQVLLDCIYRGHFKLFPHGALTLGGCNICAAPASKGTKIVICISCDSKGPLSAGPAISVLSYGQSSGTETCASQTKGSLLFPETFKENMLMGELENPFVNVKDSAHLIAEAKHAGILSDSSTTALAKLTSTLSMGLDEEGERENKKAVMHGELCKSIASDCAGKGLVRLPSGHTCYFKKIFLISWGRRSAHDAESCFNLQFPISSPSERCKLQSAGCCFMQERNDLWVRCLNEKDWLLLSNVAKLKQCQSSVSQVSPTEGCPEKCRYDTAHKQACHTEAGHAQLFCESCTNFSKRNSLCRNKSARFPEPCNWSFCTDILVMNVQKAMAQLKRLPVPVRRALPVLITAEGALLGIPSLQLSMCPHFWVSSKFCPKVPLGGGHASWL